MKTEKNVRFGCASLVRETRKAHNFSSLAHERFLCLGSRAMKIGPSAWSLRRVSCLLASFLLSSAPAQTSVQTIVDPNVILVDNFEGWGTSLCWWANMVG